MLTKTAFPLFVALFSCAGLALAAADRPTTAPLEAEKHVPEFILSDGAAKLEFGEERLVLPRGSQPSMLVTKSGSVVVERRAHDLRRPHDALHGHRRDAARQT